MKRNCSKELFLFTSNDVIDDSHYSMSERAKPGECLVPSAVTLSPRLLQHMESVHVHFLLRSLHNLVSIRSISLSRRREFVRLSKLNRHRLVLLDLSLNLEEFC